MTKAGISGTTIRDFQTLLDSGAVGGLPDHQLLERFVATRDGAAFEALVLRHGPMVWGVCRRSLGDHHDAQDAFQATFLVLARRAASVVPRVMVGNWLYGVACRTATKARCMRARRRSRERTVAEMPEPMTIPRPTDDRLPLLDLELARLPEKYRIPIVLCDLEGTTQEEAARQVGCPVGTLSGRLWRARAMLAKRLTRRGLALSGGSLAMLSQDAIGAAIPSSLVTSTATAAIEFSIGRATSTTAASLAEGVLKTMMLSKLKVGAAVVLALAFVSGGAAFVAKGHGMKGTEEFDGAEVPLANKPHGSVGNLEASRNRAKAGGALRGRWQATRFLIDGKPDPAEAVEKTELLIDDDSYRFAQVPPHGPRGLGSGIGTVRVDASRVPHEIDLTPTSGVYKGLTQKGIFEVEGDTLKLCYGMPTKARPVEFATRPNSGIYLAEFRRVVGEVRPAEGLESEIARFLRAHGGEARLRALKAFTVTFRQVGEGGRSSTTKHFIQLPDLYRFETTNPGDGTTLIRILTAEGMKHWSRGPDGKVAVVTPLGAAERPREYWLDSLKFFGPRSVLRLKDAGHRPTLLGESKVGDRPALGIRIRTIGPRPTMDRKMFFDKETGLLLRDQDDADGTATDLEDYRAFDGIPVARKSTQRAGQGRQTIHDEVVEIKAVEAFDPDLFRKP